MSAVMFPLCDFPHDKARRATVLFHNGFYCSLCADVLLEDSPAHEYARMEAVSEAATNLIRVIDAGLIA